jgi:hypothetical protein
MWVPRIKPVMMICCILISYLLMKSVIVIGYLANITGLIPNSPSISTRSNAIQMVIEYSVYIIILIIAMLIVQYIHHRRHTYSAESIPTTNISESLLSACIYFLLSSFLLFLIIVNFISRDLISILAWSIILNIIPLLVIYNTLLFKYIPRNRRIVFWFIALLLNCTMIIPYGSFLSTLFIKYLL